MLNALLLAMAVAAVPSHEAEPPVSRAWQAGPGPAPATGGADTIPRVPPPDTVPVAPGPIPARSDGEAGSEGPLSDLAVRFGGRGEFGGDWTLFRPCDAAIHLACNPGLLPHLQPRTRVSLQVDGSVADRVFLDVDWDQTREFAGANRFQVHYEGRPGEILQRVELGDVTFSLPETRFLTRGVPAGNFGVLTSLDVGGVELQSVFAQQQGARRTREFRLGGPGAEAGIIHQDTLVLDDADYVKGQFFFLVDPGRVRDSPHFDVLSLRPGDAPPGLAPGVPPVQLYRMERDPVFRQQVEGYIQADAVAEGEGGGIVESGWFRQLRPGEDYYIHPSGLWIALRAPLRTEEALAVAYIAQNGDTIGEYNPERVHNLGQVPTLRLVRATRPNHQPGRATWDLEMKQVYRLSGSDEVDPTTLEVSVSLGEASGGRTFRTAPDGRRIPFLRLFGLDEHTPRERVDRAAVFRPAEEAVDRPGIQGAYLVFPTLRPFLEPPPVPSEGLGAPEVVELLRGDVNRRIYERPDPFERDAGGLYRLNLTVHIRSAGVGAAFPLGAFGIRRGSERIYLGERLLRPMVDYVIDYDSGVVTLLQPELLLAARTSETLEVSWEEAAVFREAPTSVLGLNARVPFGAAQGGIDFMGLYQVERELVNRPRFGSEPAAVGMMGIRSDTRVDLPRLGGFLDRISGGTNASGAELRMEGEVALSLPEPNLSGDAYLDDFDAGNERTVSLISTNWHLGSVPAFQDGARDALPPVLDERSAASLVWQHNWVEEGPQRDSVGTFEGFVPAEIDRQINVAGAQSREPGLRLTFGEEEGTGAFHGPRWRSVTTLLSPSGADLTQTEFLDFYAAEGDSLVLIVDVGLVSEDAFFIDDEGRTSGFHPGTGRPWGQGVLDQEADPLMGEVWNREADDRGVWNESCEADPGRVHRLGDPRANCTRGNARRDTEDLNRNGVLDTTERYMRYVIRLDGSSPYLARSRNATGTGFRLYRVPLRGPNAVNPGGQFTDADWRGVQFMRVTVAGERPEGVTLARMRLVGSRWIKRSVDGVLAGIGGDTLALGGQLEVKPVSVLTEGAAYQAPPGVLEQLDDPASAVSGRGVEFGERALGLQYRNVGAGDRVEVYHRFLQRPRNFLSYGSLRLWAVARRGQWGEDVPTDFFLKVGSDPDNFYLYRSRLEPARNGDAVQPEDWLPERVVEFDRWTELRQRAEHRLLREPRRPGDPPVVEWSADSTYAVVLQDRARAPNLAAVREISMGIWNRGQVPVEGELWVNELRLGRGLRTPGAARYANLELDGGEVLQARLDYSGQGSHFRQLHETPAFLSDGDLALSGTLQVGAMLPESWGWELPLSVAHRRSDQDPFFLQGTDLQVELFPGIRTEGHRETRVSLGFRPTGEVGHGLLDAALEGVDARLAVIRGRATTLTTESRSSGMDLVLGYTWSPAARTVGVLPGFLEGIARVLLPPSAVRRLRETELRWSPEEVGVRSGLHRRSLEVARFESVLAGPGSGEVFTESAPEALFESRGRLALRPFRGLGVSLDMVSARDVLELEDGIRDPRVRPVVEEERFHLLGRHLGWEIRRELVGRLTFRPTLPRWIRTDLGIQTRYRSDRDAGLVRFEQIPDSVPHLLRNTGAERDLRASATLDPQAVMETGLPPEEAGGEGEAGLLRGARTVAGVLNPLTISLQDGITSRFHREPVSPGAGFQLGWGGFGGFESIEGVSATTLVDRRGLSGGSGLTLPGGLFTNVNFQSLDVETLDRRSDRRSRSSTWPDLRVGVADVALPEDWRETVRRISMNVGFQRTRDEVTYGGGGLQARTRDDRRIPVELAVEWEGGLVTRYRGLFGWGDGGDPTGVTERGQMEHGISAETRLAPRGELAERMEEPMRLSLVVQYARLEECRIVSGRETCVPFLDQVNRGVNLTLDTRVSGMEVGGHVSLMDRRSFTDLRTGFTQFQVGIWGRLLLEAGPVDRLQREREPF